MGGQIFDLGHPSSPLNNPGFFLGNSRGVDINDSGNIVGKSESAFGEVAFLFDRAVGTMRDLGIAHSCQHGARHPRSEPRYEHQQ